MGSSCLHLQTNMETRHIPHLRILDEPGAGVRQKEPSLEETGSKLGANLIFLQTRLLYVGEITVVILVLKSLIL